MTMRPGLRARVLITMAVWAVAGAVTHACPICFQMDDGPVSSGIRAGVGVMFGVTAIVIAGFARFSFRLAVRQNPAILEPGTRNARTSELGTPEPRDPA